MRELIKQILREEYDNSIVDEVVNFFITKFIPISQTVSMHFRPGLSVSQQGDLAHTLTKLKTPLNIKLDKSTIVSNLKLLPYEQEQLNNIDDDVFIKTLGQKLNIGINSINELPKFISIKGSPFFIYYDKKFILVKPKMNLGSWTTINNKIWVSDTEFDTNIHNLSTIKEVIGNFSLSGIQLKEFGGLEKVKGNFVVADGTVIFKWDTLKQITGDFTTYENTSINSLGQLIKVGGKVDLRGDVYDLGSLEYVGEDLIITNQNIRSLNNLKYVGGRLRIRKTALEDIGDLEYVQGAALVDKNTHPNVLQQLKDRGIKITKG